ncbi:MAG TPA: energy transducer TonB [Balneolales bacterium]|nr:energy transducer TonB [Balneolales bacterium]
MNAISLFKKDTGTSRLVFLVAIVIAATSPVVFAQTEGSARNTYALSASHPSASKTVSSFMPDERKAEFLDGLQAFKKSITYPYEARRDGVEGTVVVRFVVDPAGNVVSPLIITGIGHGCDEAAVNALRKTRFMPAMQNRKPVSTVCEIPIKFRLIDQSVQ